MNRTPSSHPSPPVGEKVPGGRLRGIPIGSWLRFTSEFWRCPLPMSLPLPTGPARSVDRVRGDDFPLTADQFFNLRSAGRKFMGIQEVQIESPFTNRRVVVVSGLLPESLPVLAFEHDDH